MKNKRKILLLLFFFIGIIAITYGVDPPPIDAGGPGTGATPVGGSAPIGTGYVISIVLALCYGIYIYAKNSINLKLTHHEK